MTESIERELTAEELVFIEGNDVIPEVEYAGFTLANGISDKGKVVLDSIGSPGSPKYDYFIMMLNDIEHTVCSYTKQHGPMALAIINRKFNKRLKSALGNGYTIKLLSILSTLTDIVDCQDVKGRCFLNTKENERRKMFVEMKQQAMTNL